MQLTQTISALSRGLRNQAKTLCDRVQGIPPISPSKISKELIQACVGRDDPTILEIGCNDGGHSLWLLDLFSNPTVYCFEPDPRAIARFKKTVGRRANVTLFEMAISDHDGEVAFHQSAGERDEKQAAAMPEGWDLSGSIRRPKDHLVAHPWVKFDRTIQVATSTLDSWSAKHRVGPVDFIWMDVQGAEIDVFRGGMETIARTRFLYTEYGAREFYEGQGTLRQLMKRLAGFRILVRYPGDVLLMNTRLANAADPAVKRRLEHALESRK